MARPDDLAELDELAVAKQEQRSAASYAKTFSVAYLIGMGGAAICLNA